VAIRIDGQALLSAVRYELEKLRCSACGEVFTAGLPAAAGEDKYSARARAVLALGRYYLGLPFYRIEQFQAMVGVPVADATQWDQVERVADSVYPVFEQLKYLAAQSAVIYQDDTHVRILSLLKENREAAEAVAAGQGEALERTGMYTTGLVASDGERTICLYLSGRAHAGENLAAVLSLREADREPPIVMSDALAANALADEAAVIRSHCLAHGRRYFTDIEEVFPEECERVIGDFKKVFEHEAVTCQQAMSPSERLAYHQKHSGPLLNALKSWLEAQFEQRLVEPNSSLSKAFNYLLNHWPKLTRFLTVSGAPLENNIVERALKLAIRQRKNSLFHASEHSAYVASVLTSVIATGVQAGVDVLAYLVALQANRRAVFRDPGGWLPWNYPRKLEPG
jgi:NTP pyrophosphatase (non-canonical NTP hydrolase)